MTAGKKTALIGDVDENSSVEVVDATWIQRHAAKIDMPFTLTETFADVDGDGDITVMDATAIQRNLCNLKTPYKIGEPIK